VHNDIVKKQKASFPVILVLELSEFTCVCEYGEGTNFDWHINGVDNRVTVYKLHIK